ncbi:MAG TPA: hypothetical protein VGF69_19785 [Thermoanaerobaculia bacterium]|jgi:chromosome segregation ATPase
MTFATVLILSLAVAAFWFGTRWVARSPHFSYEPAAQSLGVLIVGVVCVLAAGILLSVVNGKGKGDDEDEEVVQASATDTAEKRSAKLEELNRDYRQRLNRLSNEVTSLESELTSMETGSNSDVGSDQIQLEASARQLASNVANITPDNPRFAEYQAAASTLATTNSNLRYKLDRIEADRGKLQRRIEKANQEARELVAEMPEARSIMGRLNSLKLRGDEMAKATKEAADRRRSIDNSITNIMRALENNAPTSTAARSPFS